MRNISVFNSTIYTRARVGDPRLPEALLPEQARIAGATRLALRTGLVAGRRQRKIEAEGSRAAHDVGLARAEQRRMNAERRTFDSAARSEVRHALERLEKLGAAVGISGVVEGVGADEDRLRPEDLGPGERVREKERVARRNVRRGDR